MGIVETFFKFFFKTVRNLSNKMNAILRQHKNSKNCHAVIACFGPSHQDSILSKTTRLVVIPGTSTPLLEGTDQTCTRKCHVSVFCLEFSKWLSWNDHVTFFLGSSPESKMLGIVQTIVGTIKISQISKRKDYDWNKKIYTSYDLDEAWEIFG